ncbi:MAG: hypothetical protein WD534_03290 [Phycisphaeraceae bacterium]
MTQSPPPPAEQQPPIHPAPEPGPGAPPPMPPEPPQSSGVTVALIAVGAAVVGLVFICIIALLIGILLPALGAARSTAQRMQNNTQIRGIHQAMVMYAQGNNSRFPGITQQGQSTQVTEASVHGRLRILLDGNFFTPEYLVSPSETDAAIHEWQYGNTFTDDNHSYAILSITAEGARRAEWSETLNSQAIVMGDRNIGAGSDDAQVESIHNSTPGYWRGGVAYNDNRVTFETTHRLPTRFGSDPANQHPNDNLFEADGDGDALLIHSGQ